MASRTKQRKSQSRRRKPATSRAKVRAHRARLREKGMRPVTIWVPDMRSATLASEARRQSLLANKSAYAEVDQAWADSMIGNDA
jgi:Antitoxin MazE-like